MDSHTRVSYRTNPTYLERVGGSFFGIFIGIGLILSSSALLWWNEGRAVQTDRSLREGFDAVLALKSIEVAFDENNGKLVHLSGPLRTDKPHSDTDYGVAVTAVKLNRHVEMFQWIQHETRREFNEGGVTRTETSFSYSKEWRSDVVSSSSFDNPSGHHNPSSMVVSSKTYSSASVQVGNFYLSQGLISLISDYKPLTPKNVPSGSNVRLIDGIFYHSKNPLNPEIGDLKVRFEYAGVSGKVNANIGPPEYVSIIARQQGIQLTKYETQAGDDLEILHIGELSAERIFALQHASNNVATWIFRTLGWFLVFIGFGFSTSILRTLVDWMPIVRELVGIGVTLVNVALSISYSLTIIALAWIRFRPWFGGTILAMAMVPFLLARQRAQFKKQSGK